MVFGRGVRAAGCLVSTRLQQDIEFGTVLIDGAPQQVRLSSQRHKHFIEVPRGGSFFPQPALALDPIFQSDSFSLNILYIDPQPAP